jgi:hypothetical protein
MSRSTPEEVAGKIHRQTVLVKSSPHHPATTSKQKFIETDLQAITEVKLPSKVSWIHKDLLSWREMPVTETYMDRISTDLHKWIEDKPECLMIEEFLHSIKMSYDFYSTMKERSPRLQSAHDYAMMVLGIRRERGGLTNNLNAGLVERSQHAYSRTWKNAMIERDKSKAQEQANAQGIVTVMIPDFGKDPRVPARLKKEEEK